ncbi:MAG: extracellular solute-binding protein [Promicromonosporaceae bacterium]|nr:extracellular solute-binding protein [Promicromonosporaceae bacterium]
MSRTTSWFRATSPRRLLVASAAGATVLALVAACGGGGGFSGGSSPTATDAAGPLSVLIGSSGDAETQSVTAALAAWDKQSGKTANLTVASDLVQQLSQGFAAGSPPDVFYVSTDQFAGYAANGSLEAYGDKLDKSNFYPTLVDSFSYGGKFYCAPKDFSTLQLIINTDAWQKAGLTSADYPTTWDQLKTDAQKLTTGGQTGLVTTPEWARIGAFMAQAGGGLVDKDGHAAVDSDANVQALTFVKSMLATGAYKFASDVGAGWGGEAFGTQKAAMTIEGNWIVGAMQADYPNVKYAVVPLPKGPGGAGTLQFTNCWGIAADSHHQNAALDLVKFLISDQQQMAFAKGFGVMPSIKSVADQWKAEFPAQAAFLDGAAYAQGVPPLNGIAAVITEFNSQLQALRTSDPKTILTSVQGDLKAIAP